MKLMAQTGGGAEGVVKERRTWWSWLLVALALVAVLVILWLVLLTAGIKLIEFDEKIRTFAVAPADFDGDGDLDLVLANDVHFAPVPDPEGINAFLANVRVSTIHHYSGTGLNYRSLNHLSPEQCCENYEHAKGDDAQSQHHHGG